MGSNQMGEIQCPEGSTLPAKRKLDPPICEGHNLGEEGGGEAEEEGHPNKKTPKLQSLSPTTNNHCPPARDDDRPDPQTLQPAPNHDKGKSLVETEGGEDAEEEDDGDYQESEEDGDEEEEEEGEDGAVDRKGKGILIEDQDDDEDSSEDDDESEVEDDSEVDEDPLAEVDLDNILPSRTRSRISSSQPGISIGHGSRNDRLDNGDSDA